MAYSAKATEKWIEGEVCWFVRCPECKCKWQLDECPAPGGMALNIEPCPECGIEIQIVERGYQEMSYSPVPITQGKVGLTIKIASTLESL